MTKKDMDAYRQAKLCNRRLSMDIDTLKATKRALADQVSPIALALDTQIKKLTSTLNRSEENLSGIGSMIAAAIVTLPDLRQQLAMELYYLDLLPVGQIPEEIGTSYGAVYGLIRRASNYIVSRDGD